jgi:serine/threonine protein kinase/tetrahydromethanopterin S-methyltransferase subunit F
VDPLASQLQTALGPAYEITTLLGRGGMGAVYRATDRRLRREVAIKVLPPALGYSEERRARFVREARIAAGLSHPNIVSIHDVGESGDLVWFVMALVEGESLTARVERDGPLPIGQVRRVLQEVAQALGYAHARGVVHRDVKPDNILLDRATGRAMVTDFGIALGGATEEEGLTQPGELMGTARYMAPEQAMGESVDARADQYALGLVTWFMLTGRHALPETSLPAVIARHARGNAIDLHQLDRQLPGVLQSALARCLATRPEERFERVEQLAEALAELGGDLPDTPAPVRTFLRETERTFLFSGMLALGLGLAGVGNVPPILSGMLAISVLVPWVKAIERAGRQRVTWPMIRRAIYLERARRLEEVEERPAVAGLASGVLFASVLILIFLSLGKPHPFPEHNTDTLDTLLLLGGGLSTLLVTRTLGMRKGPERAPDFAGNAGRPKSDEERRAEIRAFGALGALAFFVTVTLWKSPLMGLVGAPVGYLLGVGLYASLGRLRPHRAGRPTGLDWQFPRWLDQLGSWLFARVVRRGWRPGLEREVAPERSPELTPDALKRPLKRIRAAVRARGGAAGAQQAAEELAAEGTALLGQLKPLLGRLARLNDGVLASRTIGLGGSLESELDRVEAEADGLRSRAAECARLLEALAASLERSDSAGTNAILERARALASDVRRLSQAT